MTFVQWLPWTGNHCGKSPWKLQIIPSNGVEITLVLYISCMDCTEPQVKTGVAYPACISSTDVPWLKQADWQPMKKSCCSHMVCNFFLPFACVGSIGLWHLNKTWIPGLQWVNGFMYFSLPEEMLKENGHQEKFENGPFHHMDAQLAHVSLTCDRIHLVVWTILLCTASWTRLRVLAPSVLIQLQFITFSHASLFQHRNVTQDLKNASLLPP